MQISLDLFVVFGLTIMASSKLKKLSGMKGRSCSGIRLGRRSELGKVLITLCCCNLYNDCYYFKQTLSLLHATKARCELSAA